MYFCAIPSSSPIQNELSLTTPHFSLFVLESSVPKSESGSYISLFVLELLFPNRKAEVIFHYSFWNFRSQIEKRNLVGQNQLSLATAQFFTIRFGTSASKSKSGSYISLFVLELPFPN